MPGGTREEQDGLHSVVSAHSRREPQDPSTMPKPHGQSDRENGTVAQNVAIDTVATPACRFRGTQTAESTQSCFGTILNSTTNSYIDHFSGLRSGESHHFKVSAEMVKERSCRLSARLFVCNGVYHAVDNTLFLDRFDKCITSIHRNIEPNVIS